MRCASVCKRLSQYMDLEVPPKVREDIRRHLAQCADCRNALARLEQLGRVLTGTDLPPVPEEFAARVMRAARAQVALKPEPWWSHWTLLNWWWNAALEMRAAAITVVLVGLTAGLAMSGGFTRPSATSLPQRRTAEVGPVVQNIDFLGGIPAGSVEQTYLTWVAGAP
jgi:anti-sigma factor RsiW